jgi:hypothetical protein
MSAAPYPLVERGQASIAPHQSRQTLKHGVAICFKLPVGQGIGGERVHGEQGAESPAVGIEVAISEQPKLFPHGFRRLP